MHLGARLARRIPGLLSCRPGGEGKGCGVRLACLVERVRGYIRRHPAVFQLPLTRPGVTSASRMVRAALRGRPVRPGPRAVRLISGPGPRSRPGRHRRRVRQTRAHAWRSLQGKTEWIDRELAPFYCPDCARNHCHAHWRTYVLSDEGHCDSTVGRAFSTRPSSSP